jgi:hypothetical protein
MKQRKKMTKIKHHNMTLTIVLSVNTVTECFIFPIIRTRRVQKKLIINTYETLIQKTKKMIILMPQWILLDVGYLEMTS